MYPRTIIDSLPAVPNRDQLTHKDAYAAQKVQLDRR